MTRLLRAFLGLLFLFEAGLHGEALPLERAAGLETKASSESGAVWMWMGTLGHPSGMTLDGSVFLSKAQNIGVGAYFGGDHPKAFGRYGQALLIHPRYRYYWRDWGFRPFAQAGLTYESRSYPGGYPPEPSEDFFAGDLALGGAYLRPGGLNFEILLAAAQWYSGGASAFRLGVGLGLGWVF